MSFKSKQSKADWCNVDDYSCRSRSCQQQDSIRAVSATAQTSQSWASVFFISETEQKPIINEKAPRETQTLRARRSRRTESAMAVVRQSQNFPPPQTPFPGVQDRQNLTSWRWSLSAPKDPVWWSSMHAISSYRGNRHRPPARHKHTERTDYNTLRRCTQCNKQCLFLFFYISLASHLASQNVHQFKDLSFTYQPASRVFYWSTILCVFVHRVLINLFVICIRNHFYRAAVCSAQRLFFYAP